MRSLHKTVVAVAVALLLAIGASTVTAAVTAVKFSSSQSVVTGGISKISVKTIKDAGIDSEYQVLFWRGSQSYEVLRVKGLDSESVAQTVYFLTENLFASWGLTVE